MPRRHQHFQTPRGVHFELGRGWCAGNRARRANPAMAIGVAPIEPTSTTNLGPGQPLPVPIQAASRLTTMTGADRVMPA